MGLFLRSLVEALGQIVRSIRFRITLWTLGMLAFVLITFSAFIFYNQEISLELDARNHLLANRRQMANVAVQLLLREAQGSGNSSADTPAGPPGMNNPADGDVFTLASLDGKVLQSTGQTNQAEIAKIAYFQKTSPIPSDDFTLLQVRSSPWFDFASVGEYYMLAEVTVPTTASNASYLIVASTPIDPSRSLPVLLGGLVRYSLVILLVALVGGYWLAGRLMAPVRKITRTAQDISGTDLSRRIQLKTRDELGDLANTFDRMLDRLQGAFDRQRQFTSDASHELRTPLTIVDLETSRALEHRRTPAEYEQALNVIHSENQYMTRLVTNLLTLARMDAGRAALTTDCVDLGDLAVDVIERLEPLARQKGVELAAGDLPEVLVNGDRQYLIQMLTNLVENSIKYSRAEGGRVGVEAGTRQEGGKALGWVRVEDNGPGIPQEAIPHLFDRFYRVDSARSHNPDAGAEPGEMGGSGLGLSIVDWIVKAHNGQIRVASQLGLGSSFEVEIPLAN
jgi:signal transduction histidine kinase